MIFDVPDDKVVQVRKGPAKLVTVDRGLWIATIEYLEYRNIIVDNPSVLLKQVTKSDDNSMTGGIKQAMASRSQMTIRNP